MDSDSVPTTFIAEAANTTKRDRSKPHVWGTLDAEDLLVCTLCSRYFTDPRVLKCDHTFCRSCLQELYNERQAGYGTKIATMPCPTCQSRTHLPVMGVSGLPLDSRMRRAKEVFVNELMEDVRRRSSSTEPDEPSSKDTVNKDNTSETLVSEPWDNNTLLTSDKDIHQSPRSPVCSPKSPAALQPQSPPVVQPPPSEPVSIPVPPPRRKRLQHSKAIQEESTDSPKPREPSPGTFKREPSPETLKTNSSKEENTSETYHSLPKISVEPESPPSIHFDPMDSHRFHPDLSSSLPRSFTDPDLSFSDHKPRKSKEEPSNSRFVPKSRAGLFEPREKEYSFSGLKRSNSDRLRSKRTQDIEEELRAGTYNVSFENTRGARLARRNSRRFRANRTVNEEGEADVPRSDSLHNGHARPHSPAFASSSYQTESPSFDSSSNHQSDTHTTYTSTESPGLGSRLRRNTGRSASFNDKYNSPSSSSGSRFERRSETPTYESSSRYESYRSETPTFGSTSSSHRSETPTFESRYGANRAETPTFGSHHISYRSQTPTFESMSSSHGPKTPTFESRYGENRSETPTFGSHHSSYRSETPTFESRYSRKKPETDFRTRRSETPTFESRYRRERAEKDFGIHRSETPTFESRYNRPETPSYSSDFSSQRAESSVDDRYASNLSGVPETGTTGPEHGSSHSETFHRNENGTDETNSSFNQKAEMPTYRRRRTEGEAKETLFTQDNNNNGIFSSRPSSSRPKGNRSDLRRKRWSYPAFTQTNSPLFDKYLRDSDDDEEEDLRETTSESTIPETVEKEIREQGSSTDGSKKTGATAESDNANQTTCALSPAGEPNTQSFTHETQSELLDSADQPDGKSQDKHGTNVTKLESGVCADNGGSNLHLEESSEEQEIILEEREVEVKLERTFNITSSVQTDEEKSEQAVPNAEASSVKVSVEVDEDSDEGKEEKADEDEGGEDSPEPVYQPAEHQWSVEKAEHDQPTSLAMMPSGKVIVADYGHSNLQFYNDEGQLEHQVEGLKPYSMMVDKKGNVVVGDRKSKTLKIFDEVGTDVAQWPENVLDWVSGIGLLSDGTIVVMDRQYCRVKLFSCDGETKSEFGSYGTKDKQLAMADFLAVDSNDRIIVCDSGNHCIKVFDPEGKLLLKFGSRGTKRGQLQWPKGVCVDDKDNIIVADTKNNRVCMFNPQGEYIQRLVKDVPNPFAVSFTKPNQLGVTQFALNGESDFRIYKIDEVLADLSLEETL